MEKSDKIEHLVSIIMPAYNSEDFIGYAIESVIAQTYSNWELIIVDDCSTDKTAQIINDYSKNDSRIKYKKLSANSGAAVARNKAIEFATGRFIAFLDSDDVWVQNKLEKQINYMITNNYSFTCTSYDKISEHGVSLGKIRKAKVKSDYNGVLHTCPGNSTVIYDAGRIGKFFIPDIKKRNDYVMWLQIMKKVNYLYGIEEVMGSQRMRTGSISSNKTSLIKYHWKVYREIEKLSFIRSLYLIGYWIIVSAFKLR